MDPSQRRRSVSLSLRPTECRGGGEEVSATPSASPLPPVRSASPSMPNLRNDASAAAPRKLTTMPSKTNLDRARLPSPIVASLKAWRSGKNNNDDDHDDGNDDDHDDGRSRKQGAVASPTSSDCTDALASLTFAQRAAMLHTLLLHLVHTVFVKEVTGVLCYGSMGVAGGTEGLRLIDDLKARGERTSAAVSTANGVL